MRKLALCAVSLVLLAPALGAQKLLQLDPLGEPTMVRNERNEWVKPVLIASKGKTEYFVTPLDSAEWKESLASFRHDGTFVGIVYSVTAPDTTCVNEVRPKERDPLHTLCAARLYKLEAYLLDTRKQMATSTVIAPALASGDADPKRISTNTVTDTYAHVHTDSVGALLQAMIKLAQTTSPTATLPTPQSPQTRLFAIGPRLQLQGTVFQIGGGVSSPRATKKAQPNIPAGLRGTRLSGDVAIDFIVDAKGLARDPIVIQALGQGLDQAALEALHNYRFDPAMRDGQPVPSNIQITIRFELM